MSDTALLRNVLLFGRVLRRAGLEVHPGRMLDAVTAVGWVGVRTRDDLRATLRALLVHRREDMQTFDTTFDLFWRADDVSGGGLPLFALGERPRVVARRVSAIDAGLEFEQIAAGHEPSVRLAAGAYSPVEVSRTKDFAEMTEAEMRRAETIVAAAARQLRLRRTRRWQRATVGAIDLRRAARGNVRHGGELIHLPRRERAVRPRPVVALCDVSGSMERYSRIMLQLIFGLGRGAPGAESFVFATRLTRVTRQVRRERARAAGPSAAGAVRLPRLARAAQDWGGGTRIGESVRAFNVHWAQRVMRNGPIVFILSDGWDRGDPELLRRELQRLRRGCHRLVWLNPLLGSASYEPLTRGMQAALDVIDDFLPAHNLASLDELVRRLITPPHSRSWTSRAATHSMPL